MINVEYRVDVPEFTDVTLFVIESNIVLKILAKIMTLCCYICIIGYWFKLYGNVNSITHLDNFAAICSMVWIFASRYIKRKVLHWHLYRRNIQNCIPKIILSEDRISWRNVHKSFSHVLWNKVKKIYRNKNGYIIPRILHAPLECTFIWLPKTGFANKDQEAEFLQMVTAKQIKIVGKGV